MDTVATHVVRVTAESSRRVEIIVSGGSVVAGEILDEAGEPLQGVEVQALQVRSENGRTVAIRVGAAASRVTDDRGQYRIFGLPSGSYLITAKVNGVPFVAAGARAMAYAPVYYPGTPSVQSAQTLQVPFEAEVNGVNLTVPPSLSARISGKAVDAAGEPLAGLVVRLMPTRRSSAIVIEPFRTPPIGPDGAFEILDVSPGDYVVQAIGAFTFASEYVQVNDGDPPPLTLRGSAGATIEGRFIVEGMAAPPSRALTIHAMPMDTDRAPEKGRGPDGLAVYDDGRFYLTGLRGSMRFSWNSPVAGLYLKSMTIGGIDVTDSPFDFGFEERTISDAEIVLSSAGGRIAGSVTDASGNPATRFVSVAFSTSRQHWYTGSRYVVQRASLADGLFDIDGLPPGEYWVAAVESLAPGDWQTAEALDAIVPAATRVTVVERQTHSTNLRLLRREVSRPPR
jgi:hypothetical protein